MLEADARSVRERGHGNAVAQPYNHAILPLCNDRDLRTQIRWGVADFRHRFRREPEGIWLPETAADLRTLQAARDEGLRFTVLSPDQCTRVRAPGGEWQDARFVSAEPPGQMQPGQKINLAARGFGREWPVRIDVRDVDPQHSWVDLVVHLPLGVTNHEHVTLTETKEGGTLVRLN